MRYQATDAQDANEPRNFASTLGTKHLGTSAIADPTFSQPKGSPEIAHQLGLLPTWLYNICMSANEHNATP